MEFRLASQRGSQKKSGSTEEPGSSISFWANSTEKALEKRIRVTDAKEVGVENPAEETYRYPNQRLPGGWAEGTDLSTELSKFETVADPKCKV